MMLYPLVEAIVDLFPRERELENRAFLVLQSRVRCVYVGDMFRATQRALAARHRCSG